MSCPSARASSAAAGTCGSAAATPRKIPKTVLSANGYGIAKAQISPRTLLRVRGALTVAPFVARGFGPAKVRKYPIYRESRQRIYVPRHYGIAQFGAQAETRIGLGDPAPGLHFKGELRPLQKRAVDAFLASMGPHPTSPPSAAFPHGGILSLQTAAGKTVLSLHLAARVGRKTLVVVHKEFLMHQWHERIRQFLPGATVGLIQQKKVDVEGKDIVLAMLQSLSVRDYDPAMLATFGFVIADECHHLASEMFCRALPKIPARVTLGLSATPNRADGLTKVFKWYLGDVIFTSTRARDPVARNRVLRITLDAAAAGYGTELVAKYTGSANIAGMINNIAASTARTALIGALARDCVSSGDGRLGPRHLLVLSGRRQHLEDIHDSIVAQLPGGTRHPLAASIGYYVGGMRQDELKASETCHVVLATYTMAAEGLDIKALNTLLLATPMSNVTQAVGRIFRKVDPATPPLVIDLVDDFSSFSRQAGRRLAIYKKEHFEDVCTLRAASDPETWARAAPHLLATSRDRFDEKKAARPPPPPPHNMASSSAPVGGRRKVAGGGLSAIFGEPRPVNIR